MKRVLAPAGTVGGIRPARSVRSTRGNAPGAPETDSVTRSAPSARPGRISLRDAFALYPKPDKKGRGRRGDAGEYAKCPSIFRERPISRRRYSARWTCIAPDERPFARTRAHNGSAAALSFAMHFHWLSLSPRRRRSSALSLSRKFVVFHPTSRRGVTLRRAAKTVVAHHKVLVAFSPGLKYMRRMHA